MDEIFRYWNKAGCIPHHWNFVLAQTKVEEELLNPK